MITKKLWNSLNTDSKSKIIARVDKVYSNDSLLKPYNHDFDYDAVGKRLKKVLECCTLQKNGSINVIYNFMPTTDSTPKQKPVTAKQRKKEEDIKLLRNDFYHVQNFIKDILLRYGNKPYEGAPSNHRSLKIDGIFPRNCQIDGIDLYKGRVTLNIYWQGDHTDGDESEYLNKIMDVVYWGGEYFIPAETEKAFGHTRFRHGDLRITKEMLQDAFNKIADYIENSK